MVNVLLSGDGQNDLEAWYLDLLVRLTWLWAAEAFIWPGNGRPADYFDLADVNVQTFAQVQGFLVCLAALQGMPAEVEDAASIDGAGAVSRFVYVILPLVAPILLLLSFGTAAAALWMMYALTGLVLLSFYLIARQWNVGATDETFVI